jgi:Sec-independent protein translocase protein TatA
VLGIGPQELILVALLALLIFGPSKAGSVARDVGRFVQEIRRPVEEFRSELTSVGEDRNDRAGNDVAGDRRSGDDLGDKGGTRKRVTKGTKESKLAGEGETSNADVRAPTD